MPVLVSTFLNNDFTGYTGSKGDPGYTGSFGITGYIGSQGDTGFTGSRGAYDAIGFTGSQGDTGYTGSKGDTGLGFNIAKTYGSLAALTADTSPAGILVGEFALINTGNVQDADNSKLYVWNGSTYVYVNDFSGAAGIMGPQGSTGYTGSQGVGYTGSQGDTGFTGSFGNTGYTGSQGVGYTGSRGDTGFVGSQGTATNWTVHTANYTAQNRDRILADTTGGTFTVTLPATPSIGYYVEIADAGDFSANSLFVDRNGSTIESQAVDLEIEIPAVSIQFLYDGTTWQVITTAGITGATGYTGSRGNPGGNGYTITSVSTNTTLTANVKAIVDTDTTSITVTLPVLANAGDEVFVIDGTGNASVNPITINRNGHKIQGLAENMTVSTDRAAFGLTYYNVTHGWLLNNV